MADKVDYNKNIVNFSDIMFKLHNVSLQNAAAQDIKIDNTAFDDGKFGGAGEYAIFLVPKNGGTVEESQKTDYLKAVQDYVKYFVGEDASKLIKKEDLQPMVDLSNPTTQEQGEQDNKPEEQPEDNGAVSESFRIFISREDRIISEAVDLMFEEETQNQEQTQEQNQEQKKDAEDGSLKGFAIFYGIDVAGSQKMGFAETMKRKTKGLFGGMLADLMNVEVKTLGGGSIKVGRLFDPANWKNALGAPDINIATVDNNIQGIIHNDYPQSSAQVRVYDRDSLINLLRERRKNEPEIEERIRAAKYSVTIQVQKKDGAYKEFTKEKIADICTRAFGTSLNVTNRNKVTAADVIQINDWNSEYKTQSVYDVKRNSSNNSMSATGASTKESQDVFILGGNIVESIVNKLFGDDVLTESQRHTFNQIVTDIFEPYIKKHGTSKFKWDEPKVGAELQRRYGGAKDQRGKQLKDVLKSEFDQMKTFSDINDLSSNAPLNKYTDSSSKDNDNRNIVNGIYLCLKPMFEQTTPPQVSSEQENQESDQISGEHETTDDQETSEDNNISVRFLFKNPEKKNALPQLLSSYVTSIDNLGKIPDQEIAKNLPSYEEFNFVGWNPDPNEYTKDNIPDNGVIITNAEFKNGQSEDGWDLFIIPHKRLTSQNRPNKEEKFDDGTVRSKTSDAAYKPSDQRM